MNQEIEDQSQKGRDIEKTGIDFWQDHSDQFLEMAFRSKYMERIENPDAHGKRTGECGDTVEFFLMIEQDRIRRISIDVQGCIHTNACANALIELSRDKMLEEAWKINP